VRVAEKGENRMKSARIRGNGIDRGGEGEERVNVAGPSGQQATTGTTLMIMALDIT
jgi:hypothetical protein